MALHRGSIRASHPAPPGLILGVPKKISEEWLILDGAEINLRHILQCGKAWIHWPNHRASDKLVLKKNPTVWKQILNTVLSSSSKYFLKSKFIFVSILFRWQGTQARKSDINGRVLKSSSKPGFKSSLAKEKETHHRFRWGTLFLVDRIGHWSKKIKEKTYKMPANAYNLNIAPTQFPLDVGTQHTHYTN